jgi:serine/threonine protein phosphatase 1
MTGVILRSNESLAVLGDVHGCPDRLEAALADIISTERRIILIGDYINRGPGSRAVLDLLVEAKSNMGNRLLLLRGNHESALLEALINGRVNRFIQHGGTTTIRSYIPTPGPNILNDFRQTFPKDHLNLLKSTALYAEAPGVFISHAGYRTDNVASRSEEDLTLGCWNKLRKSVNAPRPLVVVGHYVQSSGQPYVSEHLICIDTGCGTIPSAPLTLLKLPERVFHAY